MTPRPFHIDVSSAVLDDLHDRLVRTRWPDEIPGAGWDYGTNLAYLKALTESWVTEFDWRAQEARLNEFHHFQADINGLAIHFIHERGRGPDPMPLVLTHGWPSTIVEMYKIIPMLADPQRFGGDPRDSFDVIAPSLPGFGFSDRPRQRGWTSLDTAATWTKLMTEVLDYERYAAHGGDVGAGVTSRIGLRHADRVIAIHISSVVQPYLDRHAAPLSDEEHAFQQLQVEWEKEEDGYGHIQGTRPQTLAYGLNDSPAALAAWIVEKYRAWSDCHGEVESVFTRDELLTNITIYWATQTINASMRHYFEQRHSAWPFGKDVFVHAPTGICLTTEPIDRCPREWAERTYKSIRRFTRLPRGGHFAALEVPELLVDDIRAFFRAFR